MSAHQRTLSLFDATMLVMGGIIGVGVFYKPHEVAGIVPEPGAFFAIWLVGAFAGIAWAMTFAEFSATFPRTGGWYVFLREGFGRLTAFLFAWIVLLVISTGACAGVADFGAEQIESVLGLDPNPERRLAIACGLIVSITALGLTGVKTSAIFQNLCMLAKLLAIGVFVVAGLAFFGDPPTSLPQEVEVQGSLGARMIRATLPVLFTMGGWQLVTYVAPHVRDPQRTLPRAIVLGVVGVAVVYLLFNAAYVRVLGTHELAANRDVATLLANHTLGEHGARFLAGAISISAIGFLVATLVATPGIYVAMSREGLFLSSVGRVSARTGAPVLALLIQMVVCLVYLTVSSDARGKLGDSVVFAEWIFHGLVGLALLRIRRLRPELPRPFRSLAYPLFPLVYAAFASVVVVGNLFQQDIDITLLGLGVLALGAVVYVPWSRRRSGLEAQETT